MSSSFRFALLASTGLATFFIAVSSAHAVGCVSGAAAGAVAGHVAGGHAVIGAAGGCMVGHELAAKRNREAEADRLIADYEVAPEDAQRRSKDVAGISRLARKGVPVATKWMQDHGISSK